MSETTKSLLESPPYATEATSVTDATPVTDEAWDAWCSNGPAVLAESLRWSGDGYGYNTPEEVKEEWPACPGVNWTEAENCDHAKELLRTGGYEVHGELTYRAVIIMGNKVPMRTKDGWQLVGDHAIGGEVEVILDDEGKHARYAEVEGVLAVYECPTSYDCTIYQCRPDDLPAGADATRGEVLLLAGIDGTSTVENVLDGLGESLNIVWGDLPSGSDNAMEKAIREAIALHCGYRFDEESGFDDEDLERVWDDSLLEDNGVGPNVYLLLKPA